MIRGGTARSTKPRVAEVLRIAIGVVPIRGSARHGPDHPSHKLLPQLARKLVRMGDLSLDEDLLSCVVESGLISGST